MMTTPIRSIAFVGFGEAAAAFVQGWGHDRPYALHAYDLKMSSGDAATREAKLHDCRRWQVDAMPDLATALDGAGAVFSLVTADQALVAARQVARCIAPGALYLDCNSCSPGTKRLAAEVVEAAGGLYVDVAVMAPVHPALHHVPLLTAGRHAALAKAFLATLDMRADPVSEHVGDAASIKMIRSVMIKGIEALVAECTLAGRRAGVDRQVIDSLDRSFPGFDWTARTAYMLERAMAHGLRRAAEMREVAQTVEELGLPSHMARATAEWQQCIGAMGLDVPDDDYRARADALLEAFATAPRAEIQTLQPSNLP